MQARPPHDAPTLTQWRMVSILCLVNAIAFIDRTALPRFATAMDDAHSALSAAERMLDSYRGFLTGLLVENRR